MIKPLRHFITATPLRALMSLTLQHTLQYPSFSTSNTDLPSVLLLCGVCYWSWVNNGFFKERHLKLICLLKQFALAQHWINDSPFIDPLSRHIIWDLPDVFFCFLFLDFSNARPTAWTSESSQGWTAVRFTGFETFFTPDFVFCWFFIFFRFHSLLLLSKDHSTILFLSQTDSSSQRRMIFLSLLP